MLQMWNVPILVYFRVSLECVSTFSRDTVINNSSVVFSINWNPHYNNHCRIDSNVGYMGGQYPFVLQELLSPFKDSMIQFLTTVKALNGN